MNQFMRAALEAHGQELQQSALAPAAASADLINDNPELAVQTTEQDAHPDETGTAEIQQRLVAEQERSMQLQEELQLSDADKATDQTGQYVEALETAVAAMESLIDLGTAVGAAIQSNVHHEAANLGFAIALESITNSVAMTDALEDAASEARNLMVYNTPREKVVAEEVEEQAKTGGILETIKKKIKAIWDFIVGLGRRAVEYIASMFDHSKMQSDLIKNGGFSGEQVQRYMQLHSQNKNVREAKITNAEVIKRVGVRKGDSATQIMRSSVDVIDRTPDLLNLMPDFSAAVVAQANAFGSERIQRDRVVESFDKFVKVAQQIYGDHDGGASRSLPDYVKSQVRNSKAEIIASPRLAGGTYIWTEYETNSNPNKLPKIGIYQAVDRAKDNDVAEEIELISPAVINAFAVAINKLTDKSNDLMTKVAANIKKMRQQAPSSFKNVDGIEDNAAWLSSAVGIMSGLAATMANLVRMTFIVRINHAYLAYTRESLRVANVAAAGAFKF